MINCVFFFFFFFVFADCTRDEKIYKNGEKITDPDIPCHVCVCKGMCIFTLEHYLLLLDL